MTIEVWDQSEFTHRRADWIAYVDKFGDAGFQAHPDWVEAIADGLRHELLVVAVRQSNRIVGLLPLALIQGPLFGRFLVGMSYANSGGVLADNDDVACRLVERAVELADQHRVRYLELRHEHPVEHPALTASLASKVHMRLPLPETGEQLWTALKAKVRNQIRKAQQHPLEVHWGREELLADFHAVFSRNMRDLGTPVFGRRLFRSLLERLQDRTELCVVRHEGHTVAGALLVHGPHVTQVPSASSLRRFNHTNANMLMYWHLLERAIERGNNCFDFGRSTLDGPTYRFKKQWGAEPHPACWQYHLRQGTAGDMRPENASNQRLIAIWKRLPTSVTRAVGPWIVRGIP